MKKLLLSGVALVALASVPAAAQGVPQTRANMTAEITTLFPSGGTPINAANLRTAFYDLIQSTSAIYHDALVTLTGALVLGTATGGSKGAGTLNAQGIYVNGVSVASSAASQPTNFLTFGMPGSSNDTPAFNSFIAACASGPNRSCYMPGGNGQYNFTTAPACINQQINLYGDNLGSTVLFRNYNEADPTRGLICITSPTANDSVIGNMGIYSKAGTSGGALLSIVQPVGSPIGFLSFHDMNLSTTGSCTHEHTIYTNGSQNFVAPIGIRDVNFTNVTAFGGNTDAVLMASMVGVSWRGGGTFAAGCGSANAGLVAIQGTVAVPSTEVFFNPQTIQGNISIDQTIDSTILTNSIGAVGGTSVTNTANDTNVTVMATSFSGICQSNWISSNCVTTSQIASLVGIVSPALGGTGVNNGIASLNLNGVATGLNAATAGAAVVAGGTFSGIAQLDPARGGTGVNNGGNTITVSGGNFVATGGPVEIDLSADGPAIWTSGHIQSSPNVVLGASGTASSVVFPNGTSGTITLQPVTGALGSRVLSLPAATDTLVGKATTDTLTNKSIAGAEINSGLVGAGFGGTGVNNGSNTITVTAAAIQINPTANGLAAFQSANLSPYTLASLDVNSSNPTGTSSTAAFLMMGLGRGGSAATVTPGLTSRIFMVVSGDIFNPTAIADGANYHVRYGTGTAPANGDAQIGTLCGSASVKYVAATTAEKSPFGMACIASGLTPGTAYWFDIALEATTGGTASVNDVHWAGHEM